MSLNGPAGQSDNNSHRILVCGAVIPAIKSQPKSGTWVLAETSGAACEALQHLDIARILFFPGTWNKPESQAFFAAAHQCIGPLPENLVIVSDAPPLMTLIAAFEFGWDLVLGETDILNIFTDQLRISSELQKPNVDSVEKRILAAARSLKRGIQTHIKREADALGPAAETDFRAAYMTGRALEALGEYDQAIEHLNRSVNLYGRFRPALAALAENLMVLKKGDPVIDLLEQLDQTYPWDSRRKAALGSLYLGKSQPERANPYFVAADKLAEDTAKHSRGVHVDQGALEGQVLLNLHRGDIDKAMAILEKIQEAGSYLAARLNEIGIGLSKAGETKKALDVFSRTHRIVRPDLRYKISLNLALTYYRNHELSPALSQLQRCETEYGGAFEKLTKMRQAIIVAMGQAAAAGK